MTERKPSEPIEKVAVLQQVEGEYGLSNMSSKQGFSIPYLARETTLLIARGILTDDQFENFAYLREAGERNAYLEGLLVGLHYGRTGNSGAMKIGRQGWFIIEGNKEAAENAQQKRVDEFQELYLSVRESYETRGRGK